MELLALCALALVEPGMSEADHWQICGENSWAQAIRCANRRCMDRQWQIADKDTK